MRIGVPYADALKMPEHLAAALIEGLYRDAKRENAAAQSQTQMGIESLHGISALVIFLRAIVDHVLFSEAREVLRGSPAAVR